MTKWFVQTGYGINLYVRKDQRPPLVFSPPGCADSPLKGRRIFSMFFHPPVTTTVLTRLQAMFGCKTDVTSSLHTPEGIWCCFHVCCLPGSWGYPISHSNTGNRISWKTDFCGFLSCPMPKPVTWMRLLVALSFLFNNYFVYHLQKPTFFPRCSLLIRFPPHHWSPIVLGGWAIQETRKFGLHSYSCWHSEPLHPLPT